MLISKFESPLNKKQSDIVMYVALIFSEVNDFLSFIRHSGLALIEI